MVVVEGVADRWDPRDQHLDGRAAISWSSDYIKENIRAQVCGGARPSIAPRGSWPGSGRACRDWPNASLLAQANTAAARAPLALARTAGIRPCRGSRWGLLFGVAALSGLALTGAQASGSRRPRTSPAGIDIAVLHGQPDLPPDQRRLLDGPRRPSRPTPRASSSPVPVPDRETCTRPGGRTCPSTPVPSQPKLASLSGMGSCCTIPPSSFADDQFHPVGPGHGAHRPASRAGRRSLTRHLARASIPIQLPNCPMPHSWPGPPCRPMSRSLVRTPAVFGGGLYCCFSPRPRIAPADWANSGSIPSGVERILMLHSLCVREQAQERFSKSALIVPLADLSLPGGAPPTHGLSP